MTIKPIAFSKLNLQQDVSELEENSSYQLNNCYRNQLGHVCERPGLTKFQQLPGNKPIVGLYENHDNVVLAITNGKIYNVLAHPASYTEITGSGVGAGSSFRWAEDSSYVYAFGDNTIIKIDVSGGTYTRLASGPTGVTSGAFIDGYLISDGAASGGGVEGDVNYLELDGTTWSFYNQESYPGAIYGVFPRHQQIVGFKNKSIEASWNDGTTPWARVPNSIQNIGTIDGKSVVWISEGFMFASVIDNSIRIVRMEENQFKIISYGIQGVIDSALVPGYGIYGWPLNIGGMPYYVMRIYSSLTSAWETYIYSLLGDEWHKWTSYNGASETFFNINSTCFSSLYLKTLIGDSNDTGMIYYMGGLDDEYDISGTSNPIQFSITTGNHRRGTNRRKACAGLSIWTRRGEATSGSGSFLLQWSDELGAFNAGRTINLGTSTELNFVAQIQAGLGTYRGRRWKITSSAKTHGVIISGIEENFEYMDS